MHLRCGDELLVTRVMDADEQLNVRWAHDDPNPKVQKEIQEHKENRVLQAVLRKT